MSMGDGSNPKWGRTGYSIGEDPHSDVEQKFGLRGSAVRVYETGVMWQSTQCTTQDDACRTFSGKTSDFTAVGW